MTTWLARTDVSRARARCAISKLHAVTRELRGPRDGTQPRCQEPRTTDLLDPHGHALSTVKAA